MAIKESSILVQGFLHLMISQLFSRILTFGMNILILRKLSPNEYGKGAVQFLFSSTILFLSREGFRRGCLRSNIKIDHENNFNHVELQKVLDIAWLCVPAGTILSFSACAILILWQKLSLDDPNAQAIMLNGFSAFVELLSEPLYILAQVLLFLKLRIVCETAATFVRCASMLVFLSQKIGKKGGLLFAYSEFGYSVCLFLSYWLYFIFYKWKMKTIVKENVSYSFPLFPSWFSKSKINNIDIKTLHLCIIFCSQSIVKLILGEGDKFILLFFKTELDQGVYEFVSRLGSLIVRIFLQPFEESAFCAFAKFSSKDSKNDKSKTKHLLYLSLKLVTIIGCIFVFFGPNYSRLFLFLFYGDKWTNEETTRVLSLYCVYIMTLALNGMTEAFVHANMSNSQLIHSNFFFVVFSILHTLLSAYFVQIWASQGLILANIINMIMRIMYSFFIINEYFKDSKLFFVQNFFPSVTVLLSLLLSFFLTFFSNFLFSNNYFFVHEGKKIFFLFLHLFTGMASFLFFSITVWIFEKSFLKDVWGLARNKEKEN